MIKFGMKVPEIFAQLVKGYRKVTGRDPEGLDLIRIRQESLRRFQDMNKVVDMQTGKSIDPSKPIIGGSQEFASGIMKAMKTKPKEVKEVQKRIDSGVASAVEKILRIDPIDAMKEANKVIKREGDYKNLTKNDAKKILDAVEDKLKNIDMDPEDMFADGGRIGFFKGAQADTKKGKPMSPGTDTKGNVRDDNPFTGGGGDTSIDDDKPFIEPPKVNIKDIRENPYSNLNTPMGVATLSPAILARIGRMSKKIKPIFGGDVGLEYVDEAEDATTNFKITQDIEDLIKEGELNPDLKYKKEIGDDTFIEGGINKKGDASIFFKKKFDNLSDIFRFGKADGGRIGLKKGMDRRTFMKIMGGLTTLPVLGRFFRGAEKAAPMAEKAVEAVQAAPNYFFELLAKIKMFGDDITGSAERITAKKYKDYTLEEDIVTGDVTIKKTKEGAVGDMEGVMQEEYMVLKKGQADETTRGRTPPDEYEELTVRPDMEGKMKDVEDGLDSYEEIIEEVSKKSAPIKKAAGGLAYMLGE